MNFKVARAIYVIAFLLPAILPPNGFIFGQSFRHLGIPIDRCYAVNFETPSTTERMARAMIYFSDNAVPDWLLSNLGSEIFAEVIREGGLTGQDLPPFVTGSFLLLENHDKGLISETTVREIRRWSRRKLEREVARLQNLYLNPAWRQAELEWRFVNQNQLGNRVLSGVLDDILAKGTISDYASMLIRILNGTFLSAQISATMRANLETAFSLNPALYLVYGGKGGSLNTGLLNTAYYSIANDGDYAGKRRITIVFHRRIALDIFDQIFTEPFVSLQFGDKLATDRAFTRRVQSVFPLFAGR